MLKNKLSILSVTLMSIITTSSVVSCISTTRLMNRVVDPETFYGTYQTEPATWATGKSFHQTDFVHIANVVDSLLQEDAYNNIIGDTADGWTHSDDYRSWTIHLNEKAEWFDHQGQRQAPRDKGETFYRIRAHHMANTIRYSFNPASLSSTRGIWMALVKNAALFDGKGEILERIQEQFDSLDDASTSPIETIANQRKKAIAIDVEIAKYIKGDLPNTYNWSAAQIKEREDFQKTLSDEDYLIIVDDEKNTVTFNMVGPSQFFDTVLTYVAFAPMPDEAVDWLDGSYTPVKSSINATNYGKSPDRIFNSGAYYVNRIKATNTISYRANENYRDKEKTYIKNLVLNYSDTPPDSSKNRIWWENSDISDVKLSPNDIQGWARYAGKDWETEPVFEGAHTYNVPSLYSEALMFNYLRTAPRSEWAGDPLDNPINWAMAQRSTRALINYALNSQAYVKYFSRVTDADPNAASSFTLNRFVPKNFINFSEGLDNTLNFEKAKAQGITGIKEKVDDYSQLVADNYLLEVAQPMAKEMGIKNFDGASESLKVDNGQELFLGNDYMAYDVLNDQLKLKFKNSQTFEQKIQVLIEQVKADFIENEIPFTATNPVQFRIVDRHTRKDTSYPSLLQMSREFNAIPNIPIDFVPIRTETSDEYASLQNSGDYSALLSGWSADYADPSTYLNTMIYGGDYDNYLHRNALLDIDETGKFIPKKKQYTEIVEDLQAYTEGMAEASQQINFERYNGFANQEAKMLYKYMFFRPLHVRDLNNQVRLTYLNPFTQNTDEVGTSRMKYFSRKMVPKLWTREQYNQAKAEYEDNRPFAKDSIFNWFDKNKN